ncbi:hypothetical protein SNE40_013004 [Patella caerulea]|uniref:Uncharacterized protein n=1 Tax=Patella caerulea TaxID=87958 RepID=A0AAN8JM40_PATCE
MDQVKGPQVLVVDDLMGEDTEILQKWFTKKSHHHDTSVIYIVQNLFDKQQRTISLNAHYLVLFKNPRDKSQIGVLARQMYPSRSKYMQEAYEDATSTPRSYLLIDLKNMGRARVGLLQWFKLAANHLLNGNIQPLHAQHKKWVERNRQVLTQLTEKNMPTTEKLSLIMKPGGRGFFGGVLIRILARWKERLQEERNKQRNKFVRRTAQRGKGLITEQTDQHRALLRQMSNPRTSPDVKRRLLNQQGGAFGALLAMALPALAPLVSKLLGGQQGGKHPFLRRHDKANAMAAELSKLFGG